MGNCSLAKIIWYCGLTAVMSLPLTVPAAIAETAKFKPFDRQTIPIPNDLGMEFFYGSWVAENSGLYRRDGLTTITKSHIIFRFNQKKPWPYKIIARDKKHVIVIALGLDNNLDPMTPLISYEVERADTSSPAIIHKRVCHDVALIGNSSISKPAAYYRKILIKSNECNLKNKDQKSWDGNWGHERYTRYVDENAPRSR